MTRFAEAVAWAGSESVLNIFLLGGPVMVSVPADLTQPASVEMYPLERDADDEGLWPPCRELDLTYPTLPHDVEQILTRVPAPPWPAARWWRGPHSRARSASTIC